MVCRLNVRQWHALTSLQGTQVLDANAQLEDIFWGIYHWLDGHPTETILVSVKVDNGNNTAELQQKVYSLITSDDVKDYWVQSTLVSLPHVIFLL
jgi:1-phosphatidylinositol phosphodiesterase